MHHLVLAMECCSKHHHGVCTCHLSFDAQTWKSKAPKQMGKLNGSMLMTFSYFNSPQCWSWERTDAPGTAVRKRNFDVIVNYWCYNFRMKRGDYLASNVTLENQRWSIQGHVSTDLKIPYLMPDSQLRRSKNIAEHFCSPAKPNYAARSVWPAADCTVKQNIIKNSWYKFGFEVHTLANSFDLFVFLSSFPAKVEQYVADRVDGL